MSEEGPQSLTQFIEIKISVNAPQQVIRWNVVVEARSRKTAGAAPTEPPSSPPLPIPLDTSESQLFRLFNKMLTFSTISAHPAHSAYGSFQAFSARTGLIRKASNGSSSTLRSPTEAGAKCPIRSTGD